MDPDNIEYQMVKDQIEYHGQAYQHRQQDYDFCFMNQERMCLSLCICMNLTSCCRGRFFFCC